MTVYEEIKEDLIRSPKTWLITGVAGFIGSNLLEKLLFLNQRIVGLDNFETGSQGNLDDVKEVVTPEQWCKFTFIQGDIRNIDVCIDAVESVDYILHQAALGSVPRSIANPLKTNATNITGFLNIFEAAKERGVKNLVYAASSSTYGDHKSLPKKEDTIGNPLSPYAVTKYVNELYASVYKRTYDFNSIGLRYFNVFGKRQDPHGAYAAVIPKWVYGQMNNDDIYINGDGETSRDFCFIDNVVQANILAAHADQNAMNHVYNVAMGDRTTLNQLFVMIQGALESHDVSYKKDPIYKDFRAGDVKHSQADIGKIVSHLKYTPLCRVETGIQSTVRWYLERAAKVKEEKLVSSV